MKTDFEDFQKKLKEGIVEFRYLTVRGKIRTTYGTTTPIHKLERVYNNSCSKKIVFYDMTREHWFTLRKTNLFEILSFQPWFEK